MKDNESAVLEFSDIDWDKDHDEVEKLPKRFKLNWSNKDWNIDAVSKWVSLKFDWIFLSLNIMQVGTLEESGCSFAGGCACC